LGDRIFQKVWLVSEAQSAATVPPSRTRFSQ
jgi:hypothetical protein